MGTMNMADMMTMMQHGDMMGCHHHMMMMGHHMMMGMQH